MVFLFLYFKTIEEYWWYNTIFCFWEGFTYSIYKDKVEKIAKSHYTILLLTTVASLILISLFFNTNRGIKDNVFFMVFAFLIVLVTMKVNFNSRPLQWMGERLFPLYIYQRIPMIVLYEFDKGNFVCSHLYLYIILCGIITLLIAHFYHYWQIKIS